MADARPDIAAALTAIQLLQTKQAEIVTTQTNMAIAFAESRTDFRHLKDWFEQLDHVVQTPNGSPTLVQIVQTLMTKVHTLEDSVKDLKDAHKDTKAFWLKIVGAVVIASILTVSGILFKSYTLPMSVEMRLKEMEGELGKKVEQEVKKRSTILPFAPQITPP